MSAISSSTSSTVSSEASLAGVPLELRVHRSARRLRLRFDPRSGKLTLTLPPRVSRRRALEWAAGQADWVSQSIAAVPAPAPIGPGSEVPLYGRPHRIDWSPDRPRRVVRDGDRLLVGGPAEAVPERVLRWLRQEARTALAADTEHYARLAGVTVSRVSVGDPVSRWGSCSTSGAIRYSWRLVMAPEFVRRATAAHEVAHRVHMDHSLRFHALVRDLFGEDPKPAREWLRRHGAALHRIGG
jgi:predicted metal-dependent hydrolase